MKSQLYPFHLYTIIIKVWFVQGKVTSLYNCHFFCFWLIFKSLLLLLPFKIIIIAAIVIVVIRDRVLLYSSSHPRTYYVDQNGLRLTEICPPLPPQCRDLRCLSLYLLPHKISKIIKVP